MSYATEAELTSYTAARGITISGVAVQLLTKAHDYVESLTYKGTRTSSAQVDSFPRYGIYVDNILVDSSAVPSDIINAEILTAIAIDGGNDPLANLERETVMEKLDVMEVEYAKSARESVKLTAVDAILSKYTLSRAGQFSVVKG